MSIRLTNLSKWYGNSLVVNKLSFEVADGELFVLLGASGSGKSTVLRMIAGLARPEAGSVELNGKDVTKLPPQARGVGFVSQNYSLFRHMNVAKNIEFGLRVRRISAEERRQRRDQLLDLVDLGGLGNRYPHQLSGGQQQRVALARALAYRPSVLLLDEPFGALDMKIRGQLRKNLRTIQRKLKLTTILVTHDQEEAFELADRIAIIERGNVIEIGTPQDLYHSPRTEFAANFVGGKNVLIGRVENGAIGFGNATLPVPEHMSAHLTRVRILVRPETVLLQKDPFSADSGVVSLGKAKIMERTFLGPFRKIRMEVGRPSGIRPLVQEFGREQTMEIEAVQPSDMGTSNLFEPGSTIWAGFKSYHILETSWPKLLLCQHQTQSTSAVPAVGCFLAQKARSHAVLLSVTDSAEDVARVREKLEVIRRTYGEQVPNLEIRVRLGDTEDEILLEAQEGNYEMVILGRREKPLRAPTIRRILERAGIPVLVVQEEIRNLCRFLICSAVGEPGKIDVRVGGRLARLVGAGATVLHVGIVKGEDQRRRTERHLAESISTLETFGVKADTKIIEAEFDFKNILEESESGNYDLIIIGAPQYISRIPWQDAATQIVSKTKIPILIVPMRELD